MPDRPVDARDVNPGRVALDPLLGEIAEMLSHLDLHLGRHPWTTLTTRQKELLADLIDSHHVISTAAENAEHEIDEEPWFVARWWRENWVQPDPEDASFSEPDPFVNRPAEQAQIVPPVQQALALARTAVSGRPTPFILEEQVAVYEWALRMAKPLTRSDGRSGTAIALPSLTEARTYLDQYRAARGY